MGQNVQMGTVSSAVTFFNVFLIPYLSFLKAAIRLIYVLNIDYVV